MRHLELVLAIVGALCLTGGGGLVLFIITAAWLEERGSRRRRIGARRPVGQ